jgi:hypothetical protein
VFLDDEQIIGQQLVSRAEKGGAETRLSVPTLPKECHGLVVPNDNRRVKGLDSLFA